jgi:hypothetical protein
MKKKNSISTNYLCLIIAIICDRTLFIQYNLKVFDSESNVTMFFVLFFI